MKLSIKKKLIIGVLIVLLVLSFNFFQSPVRNFLFSISSPVQRFLWVKGSSLSNFMLAIKTSQQLESKNRELQRQNKNLIYRISQLEDLKKENDFLREAVNTEMQKDFELKLTQVISKGTKQDVILINKGESERVKKVSPVITQNKVLIGKTSKVYKDFSKVSLISNPGFVFDVNIKRFKKEEEPKKITKESVNEIEKQTIKNEENQTSEDKERQANEEEDNQSIEETTNKTAEIIISAVAKGQGNSQIILDLVPGEAIIKKGDVVFTSALGGIFPKGLLVGKVERIKKDDTKPFQTAEVNPSFNLSQIEKLFIITDF